MLHFGRSVCTNFITNWTNLGNENLWNELYRDRTVLEDIELIIILVKAAMISAKCCFLT